MTVVVDANVTLALALPLPYFRVEGTFELFPAQLRYAWPSELDLMARLAGLRLRERWSDWAGSRFTSSSTSHVSLYEHAPA